MYKEPHIESSYHINDIGRTLYTIVMSLRPHRIYEVGTYQGYSAICMAQALKDLGGNREIWCYDLWEGYEYRHCSPTLTKKNVDNYGLNEYVKLFTGTIEDVRSKPSDLIHIDISNTGEIIKSIHDMKLPCRNIIFEGGSQERDNIEWMVKYNKKPIQGSCSYSIIDERFPSLSRLNYG